MSINTDIANLTSKNFVLAGQQPLLASQFMHVQDQKPSGTNGGSSVVGINIRDINTIVSNTINSSSLASNQVTLPAGSYYVTAICPSYHGQAHQCSIYNVTNSTYLIYGTTEYSGSNYNVQASSFLSGTFSVLSNIVLEVHHNIGYAESLDGLGYSTGSLSNDHETYTDLQIWKLT